MFTDSGEGTSIVSDRHQRPVTDHAVEQEIKNEQAVVDRIYARLEAAAASARQLAADGHARARLGNFGGLVERDAIVFQAARRLASLDAAHDGLVFGRLDLRDGETRYVGRLGLRNADRDVLLVDWRAPAAAVFYQATAQDPLGVVRRRVLQSFTDRVIGVEDDLLDPEQGTGRHGGRRRGRPDGRAVAVPATGRCSRSSRPSRRSRTRRSAHRTAGVTTIAGGPGTGKTVVALHRAAYLLYTDRRRYESGGVLVVGSERRLHLLHRAGAPVARRDHASRCARSARSSTGSRASRHDVASVAAIKGSARMRQVLARTARGDVPGAPTSFRVFYRDDVLRLDHRELAAVRRRLLSGGQRRNRAAARVADELISALWEQVAGDRAREHGRDEFARTMRDRPGVRRVRPGPGGRSSTRSTYWAGSRTASGWPMTPRGLLSRQEVDELAESLAVDLLSGEPRSRTCRCIDELRYLLGEPPEVPDDDEDDPLVGLDGLDDDTVPELTTLDQRRSGGTAAGPPRPAGSIEDDAYAHVLVDEAQDLSPMQWRMLGRRGRHASWTVVGDPAQSSWPLPDGVGGGP